MKSTLTIARHELVTIVRRRSFVIMVVALPLAALGLVLILNLVGPKEEDIAALMLPSAPGEVQGYVDEAGVIRRVPQALASAFRSYPSLEEAREAALAGEVSVFFVIPSDYRETGQLIAYSRDFNPLGAQSQATAFRYVVLANVAGSEELAALLWEPFRLQEVSVQGKEAKATTEAVSYWLPYAILMLLVMSLAMSSGWLLESLSKEKETRMMEVMLSSVSPLEILAGKTLGLGAVGLVQLAVWLVTGALVLRLGGQALNIPQGFAISVGTLLWALLYFVLGYALYASLVAGLGALAPSARDASQVTWLIYIPLFIPLWFINSVVNQPNGFAAVIMSLIPFTAPVTMAARLVRVTPPAWQVALSVVLLLATAYLAMSAAARLFRAQTLLSGQAVSLASLRQALRGD